MLLSDVVTQIISPAMELLPDSMYSKPATIMLLSIGQQESGFIHRTQMGGGPARGFWQCEQGTAKTRGGIWGAFLHPASRPRLQEVCNDLNVAFDPVAIYNALATNDILAACVARLLLYTDPKRLPDVDDAEGSWDLYVRVWRPGKPRPDTWPAYHAKALGAVQ